MPLPPVPEPFYWTHEAFGPVLRCGALDGLAPHLFTTRQLQLSSPHDWLQAAKAVGATHEITATQVHGRRAYLIKRGTTPAAERPEADVLVSSDPDVAVAVRAADCVPLLLADRKGGVVAAVHAGWRGTAAGAARAALDSMQCECGTDPGDLVAAIGPCICACCYEVGSDVVDAFAAAGHPRHLIERWFTGGPPLRGSMDCPPLRLDLAAANRDQLIVGGMAAERIHIAGLCTAMHIDVMTSFRAEKERAGRIAGIIRPLRPSPRSRAGRRPC
jgi:hypothetical protein